MEQIKTSLNHEKGKVRSTSYGQIQFDENGLAEVEDGVGTALAKVSPSISVVGAVDVEKAPVIVGEGEPAITSGPVETTKTPQTQVINDAVVDENSEGSSVIEKGTPFDEKVEAPKKAVIEATDVRQPTLGDLELEGKDVDQTNRDISQEANETTMSQENTQKDVVDNEATAEVNIKSELEAMSMKDIRDLLVEAGVDEKEYNIEELKGKDGKPALIDFVIEKLFSEDK